MEKEEQTDLEGRRRPEKEIETKTIGFFDIETFRGFSSDIAVIGFKELDKPYIPFRDSVEFLEYLRRNYKSMKVFGYNSGRFDSLVLAENLKMRKYPLAVSNIIFSGSSINTFQMYNIVFKDLILGFGQRFKLSRLARDFFGEDKKDFDASNITEYTTEMVEYNKQDVLLTEKIYKELTNIIDVPISTAASMSMAMFKKHFVPEIEKLAPRRGIRASYKGGRTEIFKFKGNGISVYDVNSQYPTVMKEYPYPVGEAYHEKGNIGKDGYSFAVVSVPYSYVPYLAMKTETKLLFPYGKLYGYFTNFELRQAKKKGCEVRAFDSWVCDESEFIFEKFVDYFYNARLEAKRNKQVSKDVMFKTLLNCLYGKFGQKIERDSTFVMSAEKFEKEARENPAFRNVEILLNFNSSAGERYVLRKKKFCPWIYHDYIISSYVTAYARDWLYSYFERAGLKNIYYCDTDSIFTSGDLSNWCGDGLGLVKKEKELVEFEAIAPKFYKAVTKDNVYIKAKGFRRLNPQLLDDVWIGDARIWNFRNDYREEYKAPGGLRESLRRNDAFFSVIERSRSISSCYDKRRIVDDVETEPLFFEILKSAPR